MKLNKFKIAIFTLSATFALFSCNNEDTVLNNDNTATSENDIEMVKISADGKTFEKVDPSQVSLRSSETDASYALRFKSDAAYEATVSSINEAEEASVAGKAITDKCSGFKSLTEIFEEAMVWADKNLDETEASYKQWKSLYGEYLYFPEYKEDYGAYIPTSNIAAATVSNAKGLVVVGNEVKNVNDITTYKELQEKGHDAYYALEELPSVSTRALPIYKTNDSFIGEEVEYGWLHDIDNDRKIRFKLGRKSNGKNIDPYYNPSTNQITPPNQFRIHLKLEISFRKKTWLGWSNYDSETSTNMEFYYVDYNLRDKPDDFNGSGWSSHDWENSKEILYSPTGQYSNGRQIYSVTAVTATIKTHMRGFDGPDINWDCTLPTVGVVEM